MLNTICVYLFNLFTHAFKTILAVYLRLLRIPKITLSTSFFSEFYDSSVSWLSCAIMAYSTLIGTCTVSIRRPFRHIRRRDRSDLWTSAAKLWVVNGDAILGQSRKVWVLSLLKFQKKPIQISKDAHLPEKNIKKHITGGFTLLFSPRSMGFHDPICLAHIFHMGWNHPLENHLKNIGRQKDFQIPDPRPFRVKKLVDYGRLNQNESHTIHKTPSAFRWKIKTNQACHASNFQNIFCDIQLRDLPQFTDVHS